MDTSKETRDKYWWECGEKGTFTHCWWEYELARSLWKTIWRFLKTKTKLLSDRAIPLLGVHPMGTKSLRWRGICAPNSTEAIFTSHGAETTSVPANRWVDKENVMCVCLYVCISATLTHTQAHTQEYYSASQILQFGTVCMSLESMMLSKISQTDKDKYYMVLLVHETTTTNKSELMEWGSEKVVVRGWAVRETERGWWTGTDFQFSYDYGWRI